MIDRTDPDWWKYLQEKKAERDREYLAGEISDAVYTGRLLAYNYMPKEAQIELNLLRMRKAEEATRKTS